MKRNTLKAIVTAGGTQEWIDDVRVVTNLSTGRFGYAIAKCLVDLGFEVTLLGSQTLAQRRKFGKFDDRIHFQQFDSFESLDAHLAELGEHPCHFVFMAAAVSDYSPIRHDGKLSSSSDDLSVEMNKNPKILDRLREYFGSDTTLIGFKLLSGVTQQHLESIAHQQCQRANLEYTVANDLQQLTEKLHPISLVRKDGSVTRHHGHRRSAAQFIVDQVIDDNVRVSAMLQQPSAVQLGNLGVHEFQLVARGQQPQTLAGRVLKHIPALEQLLLSKDVYCLNSVASRPETDRDVERWLVNELDRSRRLHQTTQLAVETHNYGSVIGLRRGPWQGRLHEYHAEVQTALEILREKIKPFERDFRVCPVFMNGKIVGAALKLPERNAVLPWIYPRYRNSELGDRLLERISQRRQYLAVPKDTEELVKFAKTRGFQWQRRESGFDYFRPPTMRTDARLAASICLYNVVNQSILIGERKTPPWPDHWAFPGGGKEYGESLLQAAKREFFEETGLHAPAYDPDNTRTVFVAGGKDHELFYAVTNFQFRVFESRQPEETDEMNCRWFKLSQIGSLGPIAAGSRRIIRSVIDHFGGDTDREF